jgi:uncharacterized membrane protein YphA (DoxX/SURF4 family)
MGSDTQILLRANVKGIGMGLRGLFAVNTDAPATSAALVALRLLTGVTLFAESGAPKLANLPVLLSSHTDPLHVNALAPIAMAYAAIALGICTLLLAAGFATRCAALLVAVSLAGTFFGVDHALQANLLDPGHNSHPETIWLYMTIVASLILTGPGRYSLDWIATRKWKQARG